VTQFPLHKLHGTVLFSVSSLRNFVFILWNTVFVFAFQGPRLLIGQTTSVQCHLYPKPLCCADANYFTVLLFA